MQVLAINRHVYAVQRGYNNMNTVKVPLQTSSRVTNIFNLLQFSYIKKEKAIKPKRKRLEGTTEYNSHSEKKTNQ